LFGVFVRFSKPRSGCRIFSWTKPEMREEAALCPNHNRFMKRLSYMSRRLFLCTIQAKKSLFQNENTRSNSKSFERTKSVAC
jgi:hypothetical protein